MRRIAVLQRIMNYFHGMENCSSKGYKTLRMGNIHLAVALIMNANLSSRYVTWNISEDVMTKQIPFSTFLP